MSTDDTLARIEAQNAEILAVMRGLSDPSMRDLAETIRDEYAGQKAEAVRSNLKRLCDMQDRNAKLLAMCTEPDVRKHREGCDAAYDAAIIALGFVLQEMERGLRRTRVDREALT